jgi:hypothetical protein
MKKGEMFLVVFLSFPAISFVANAEVVLTVNGIDAAREPTEIKGDAGVVIGIEGEKEKD